MTAKRMTGNWFNVNNGAYCGIVMPEHVITRKKIVVSSKKNCLVSGK